MGTILDGFTLAKKLKENIKEKTNKLNLDNRRSPSLAVVIVGSDPASKTYVASKKRQSEEVGFNSIVIELDENISQQDLQQEINNLNLNKNVDGILVQLPLPNHLDTNKTLECIHPQKDVDGLHPLNIGLLEVGTPQFIPCTPKGIMTLIDEYNINLEGIKALVIGRSRLVGKPIASLLLSKNATVTQAHSKTKNLDTLIKEHELIVAAVGRPEFIKTKNLESHHIVIDVGIHRNENGLVGDVEKGALEKVKYLTPVPKGIGPMTIASLLENTIHAYELNEG